MLAGREAWVAADLIRLQLLTSRRVGGLMEMRWRNFVIGRHVLHAFDAPGLDFFTLDIEFLEPAQWVIVASAAIP